MALVKCRECGKEISNEARSCPNCGRPAQPMLIEKTAKKWKKAKLISWVIILSGGYLFLYNIQQGGFSNPLTGLGLSMVFVGFLSLTISKFGAWWNHG